VFSDLRAAEQLGLALVGAGALALVVPNGPVAFVKEFLVNYRWSLVDTFHLYTTFPLPLSATPFTGGARVPFYLVWDVVVFHPRHSRCI